MSEVSNSQRKLPYYLKLGQASRVMDVDAKYFSNIRPHLLTLVLNRTTHRFPLPYVLGLRDWLAPRPITVTAAADFAASSIAARKMTDELHHLRHGLREHLHKGYIGAAVLMDTLNVSRTTVFGWRGQPDVETAVIGSNLHFARDSVQRLIDWQYPEPRETPEHIVIL